MAIRLLTGIMIGGGIGTLLGYFGKCTSGTCPLTAHPFRGAIFGALLGVLFSFSLSCRQSEAPGVTSRQVPAVTDKSDEPETRAESNQETVIHVNSKADFKKYVLEAKLPCLADFFSPSCGPCRALDPAIRGLAEKYKTRVVVCKVDVERVRSIAIKLRVFSVPAVLFFDGGKERERLQGVHEEKKYSDVLDAMTREKAAKARKSG